MDFRPLREATIALSFVNTRNGFVSLGIDQSPTVLSFEDYRVDNHRTKKSVA